MSSGVITTLRGTSKKKNPFRSVASLVGYMNSHGFKKADLKERSHRGAPSAGGRMYEGVLVGAVRLRYIYQEGRSNYVGRHNTQKENERHRCKNDR